MDKRNDKEQSFSETPGMVSDRLRLRELLLAGSRSEASTIDSEFFENLRSRAHKSIDGNVDN